MKRRRKRPFKRKNLKRALLLALLFSLLAGMWLAWQHHANLPKASTDSTKSASNNPSPASGASFDKYQHSVNDPSSIWVVVNKGRILPASYTPSDLVVPKVALSESATVDNMHIRSEAAKALEDLVSAASGDGLRLMLVSGYRSYSTQASVYSGYVASQGQSFADSTSARPGHSEHQTGLAADLGAISRKCQLEKCFGETSEGKWLAANSHKHGFVIRYQNGSNGLTGYDYEPWHIRFVGQDLAAQLYRSSQTLEQFFGLPAYTDYPAKSYQLTNGS